MMQNKWCIGVLGAGKMGTDIFEYLTQYNLQLTWIIRSEQSKQKKIVETEKKLARLARWGVLTEEEYKCKLEDIDITEDISHLNSADFIIECISEELEAKRNLLGSVEQVVDQKTIILTNTSSLPVSSVFDLMRCKRRCAGLHFFYPVQLRNIVELNKLAENDSTVINAISEFVNFIDRKIILLEKPNHFVLNRLFFPYLAHAFKIIDTGKFSTTEIDNIVEQKLFPIGPFRFIENVGIKIIAVSIKNYASTEDDRIFCSSIQSHLGRLIENGFTEIIAEEVVHKSEYENGSIRNRLSFEDVQHAYLSLISVFVNTVFRESERGYITVEALCDLIAEYIGIDKLSEPLIESTGITAIVNELNRLYSLTGENMYIPVSSLVKRS